jgi:hypothetical protein
MKIYTPRIRNADDSPPSVYWISFGLLGIGCTLIAGSLLLEQRQEASGQNEKTPAMQGMGIGPSGKFASKALAELGLAVFSIGGIALLLEVPVMSSYFQTKIARTMTAKEYLKKLERGQLETLQADTLKAYWKLEGIERGGTLYDYCKNQVQGFIAEPFRENIVGIYKIKAVNGNLEVEERLSYTCRAVRGKIQPDAMWSTRTGEIYNRQEFRVTLEIPDDVWTPEFQQKHPGLERRVVFDQNDIKPQDKSSQKAYREFVKYLRLINAEPKDRNSTRLEELEEEGHVGYRVSLENYEDVDGLRIGVQTKYQAPVGRSLTWQMSHPSKNVTGVVIFEGLSFYLETFGVSEKYLHENNKSSEDSPQSFDYDSWLLPESGFVFHLLPQPKLTSYYQPGASTDQTDASRAH